MPLSALQHQSLIRGRRRRLSRNKQKMHVVQFRQGHAFFYMRLKAKAGQGSLEMVDMLCCGRWLIQYRSRPRSSCIHIHIIVGTVRSKTWTSVWHGRRARARRRSGGVSPPPSTFPSYYRPLRPSSAPVVIDNQDGRPAVSLPVCLASPVATANIG